MESREIKKFEAALSNTFMKCDMNRSFFLNFPLYLCTSIFFLFRYVLFIYSVGRFRTPYNSSVRSTMDCNKTRQQWTFTVSSQASSLVFIIVYHHCDRSHSGTVEVRKQASVGVAIMSSRRRRGSGTEVSVLVFSGLQKKACRRFASKHYGVETKNNSAK